MQIEIRREWVWVCLVISLMLVLGSLGYLVTPRAADGRPVLLLPGVRAVETYRRQVVEWAQNWHELNGHLRALLDTTDTDLLTQSQQAQSNFERAVELARRVERSDVPPTLLGLREQAAQAATAYVDASAAINRWLSAPSEENRAAAQQLSAQASEALAQLESNEWVADVTPTHAPTAQP
jgi:hypothetical protein